MVQGSVERDREDLEEEGSWQNLSKKSSTVDKCFKKTDIG